MGLQKSTITYARGHGAEHYYLCNYRPFRTGSDRLSRSLLRFKAALEHDLHAWIDCTVKELEQMNIPNDVIVIRALGSREMAVDTRQNTALDQLGKSIAKTFNLHWLPHLIKKIRYTRPLKTLSSKERSLEIKRAYSLSADTFDLNQKRILLLDDITTTGATIASIIRLVKQSFPSSRFKVFTLAKSSYSSSINREFKPTKAEYSWNQQTGWQVEDSVSEYISYSKLYTWIMNDDFS